MTMILNIIAALTLTLLPVSAPCMCSGFTLICACESAAEEDSEPACES